MYRNIGRTVMYVCTSPAHSQSSRGCMYVRERPIWYVAAYHIALSCVAWTLGRCTTTARSRSTWQTMWWWMMSPCRLKSRRSRSKGGEARGRRQAVGKHRTSDAALIFSYDICSDKNTFTYVHVRVYTYMYTSYVLINNIMMYVCTSELICTGQR